MREEIINKVNSGCFVKGHIPHNKKPPIQKKCQKCNREFFVKSSLALAVYCSRSCWINAIKGLRRSPASEFKKGQISWNKGRNGIHLSPATEFKKGLLPHNKKTPLHKKCLKCSRELFVKPSLARVVHCSQSCAKRGRISPWKGHTASPETRRKQRLAKYGIRGPAHHNWKGGHSRTERNADMQRSDYRRWRSSVFSRDGYSCAVCKRVGGHLNAHHIRPYAKFPELRYEVSNGISLCVVCHKEAHKALRLGESMKISLVRVS